MKKYRRIIKTYQEELKQKPTPAEYRFFKFLRKKKVNFRFQKILNCFIYDFLIKKYHLLIEIDGGYHNEEKQQIRDLKKEEFAIKCGYNFLRFTNKEIINNIGIVWNMISKENKTTPKMRGLELYHQKHLKDFIPINEFNQ